ncbi:conserved hypothetical protein [Pediculus humanus corporis]|uniref:Uncharacterized protein n=1 Tax=Pediculus humanus subsp. corporis TaxID=121224 RepID=E0VZW0_PEDHC|nr:uncharacterized protein Phum_PHUM539280 [Pediculus humanus corporis]EEB18916.1 conserved hypothetical protein [Pediculus humanus corporis]
MAAATTHGGLLYYVVPVPKDGEIDGTDSGWDNPFRPDGDLSREADEIVGLIKEGKPITPTSVNGNVKTIEDELDAVAVMAVQSKPQQQKSSSSSSSPPPHGGTTVTTPTKKEGTNGTAKHDKAGVVDVQRTIVSPSAGGEVEPVVIKKKPKCKCCVIQ